MTHRTASLTAAIVLLAAGCTLNVPFDPAGFLASLPDPFASLREVAEKGLADPLGSKPFPMLVGGDSERIFYGTNLGDTRINFPGPTNDVVVPGFFGPSNLYKHENNERELIRPVIPSGLFGGLRTDGVFVAYLAYPDGQLVSSNEVVVQRLDGGEPWVLFDASERGPNAHAGQLVLDQGRVAFLVSSMEADGASLRIEDADGFGRAREIEVGNWSTFDLNGNRVVYELNTEESSQLFLLDLATDETVPLVSDLPAGTAVEDVFLTANRVVWSEWFAFEPSRVVAYDIPTATTSVWTEALAGELTGAADGHFLTEEVVLGDNEITQRIVIRLHEVGGRERKLVDFRADGLAGQSRIFGDRVVFVNPERRIVTVPINGGDRKSFRPF